MFEAISEQFQRVFTLLGRKGRLSSKDIEEALRKMRLVLLEADVNFKVVKDFIDRVRVRSQGSEVLRSLTPHQQVIKIIKEEMTLLLGGESREMKLSPSALNVILLIGLQGSGKTTTCAKLANKLKAKGYSPLLLALDTKRPAATEQLEVLSKRIGVRMVPSREGDDPLDLLNRTKEMARRSSLNPILADTAGRLHIDHELMNELKRLKGGMGEGVLLLVLDAMTGQDGINIAKTFNEEVGFDGVVLTKLDGDTRGGVALSLRWVTQSPIMWVGVGEGIDDLERFHPDRMASRIMGMGDVLTLIEKAERQVDEDRARELHKKLRRQEFNLEDLLEEIKRVKRMGPIEELVGMIPGFGSTPKVVDNEGLSKGEAIINSMTPLERRNPEIINGSRRRRIANGSGTSLQDVNRLLRQFEDMKVLMKRMKKRGIKMGL
jgi:signal recognition particle subunit SRP54